MLKIARRVGLSDSTGNIFLRWLHREQAARLLAAGAIATSEQRGGIAVQFRQASGKVRIDARPGSYGIDREHLETGGMVYMHKPTHEAVLAA